MTKSAFTKKDSSQPQTVQNTWHQSSTILSLSVISESCSEEQGHGGGAKFNEGLKFAKYRVTDFLQFLAVFTVSCQYGRKNYVCFRFSVQIQIPHGRLC